MKRGVQSLYVYTYMLYIRCIYIYIYDINRYTCHKYVSMTIDKQQSSRPQIVNRQAVDKWKIDTCIHTYKHRYTYRYIDKYMDRETKVIQS